MSLRRIFDVRFFIVIGIIVCLFFFLFLPFSTGLKGVIVETHPFYWLCLILAFFFMFRFRKSHYLLSLILAFSIGLSLRLLIHAHIRYAYYDPWGELASVNYIRTYGFNLKGYYYHSQEPVLHMLLFATIPIFGEYNAVTFLGPIFGWTLGFIFLYKLSRCFLDKETTLYIVSLYSTMSICFQSVTVPEQIGLPIGIATVYFFHKTHITKSRKSLLVLILAFTLLNFTHNLTAFSVLVALGASVLVARSKNPSYSQLLLMTLVVAFLVYWQNYQELLSTVFLERTLPSIGEIPMPWPKPLWWWVCYLTPKLLLFFVLAWLAVETFLHKEMRSMVPLICIAGGSLVAVGVILIRGFYPWRMLNQFGSYFAIGVFWFPKTRARVPRLRSTLAKILIVVSVMGLLADFPITNMKNYYVGGYWLGHSEAEVSAVKYLEANAPSGYVVMDQRCGPLVGAFSKSPKKLLLAPGWNAYEVYNITSTEETWRYCVQHGYDYIFVSEFYEVIAVFDEISGARKLSEEQLMKFRPPYFTCIYNQTSEVWVYKVNVELESGA